jgi:predicted secreted protein
MRWPSIVAIYVLFWVMCAFVVMPFFVRTSEELGQASVPGQSESAPHLFEPRKIGLWTTIVSAGVFALYYANYVNGWLTTEMLDFTKW